MPFVVYNNLYFLTCTIHKWQPLLQEDNRKNILLESFSFLVQDKRMVIYAFVVLDNHFHLILEVIPPKSIDKIKHSLLSYTAKELLDTLSSEERQVYEVQRNNKSCEIWKPESLSVEITNPKFLKQKMDYLHKNVSRAGLDESSYLYSSIPSYLSGTSKFDFLTLWG